MSSAEERLLFRAVRSAEDRAVCRHGFPYPVEMVSKRFGVDANGVTRWAQVPNTNRAARCPDEGRGR